VEYQLEGVNQVQVSVKRGLTFAVALRSILRQDPDTILIGEIRDQETVEIAVKAALTGHLVFSTPPHERCAVGDHQDGGHGRRSLPGRLFGDVRGRPAARAEAVHRLQEGAAAPAARERLLKLGFVEADLVPDLSLQGPVGCRGARRATRDGSPSSRPCLSPSN